MRRSLSHACGAIAGLLVVLSWVAAAGTAIYLEYLGWRQVFVDDNIVGGLLIALGLAFVAFAAVQTVIALFAVPFVAAAARLSPRDDTTDQTELAASAGNVYDDYGGWQSDEVKTGLANEDESDEVKAGVAYEDERYADRLPCPHCGKRFRSPNGLSQHLAAKHGLEVPERPA